MTRSIPLLSTVLGATLALAAISGVSRTDASPEVTELEMAVRTASGDLYAAHFLVAAESPEGAARAASAALRTLYPGGDVQPLPGDAAVEGEEGKVSAQWDAWGWAWAPEELPVPVYYNPAGAPIAVASTDIASALDAWSTIPGSSFAFDYQQETALPASMNAGGEDGYNVVAWQDLGCDGGCVLGLTTKSFEAHEVDISLNSNPGARLGTGEGDTYDTLSVLVHELGHMAGLEHSCQALGPCTDAEAAAVMYWSYRGVARQLGDDDIAALVTLYPGEGVTSSAAGPVPGPGLGVASTSPSLIVPLTAGWNLTELPAGPLETSSASLACVQAVYAYDPGVDGGWSRWIRGLYPSLQTLTAAEPGVAYWVLGDGACLAQVH